MTAQEVFDKAVNGIRAQGRRSIGSDDRCLYRGPNGLKCAVGQLIPNEEYAENMESLSLIEICGQARPHTKPTIASLATHYDLLLELQTAHDVGLCAAPPTTVVELYEKHDWYNFNKKPLHRQILAVERAFATIAARHGLKYKRKKWAKPKETV